MMVWHSAIYPVTVRTLVSKFMLQLNKHPSHLKTKGNALPYLPALKSDKETGNAAVGNILVFPRWSVSAMSVQKLSQDTYSHLQGRL